MNKKIGQLFFKQFQILLFLLNHYNIYKNNFDYNYLSSLYLYENKSNIKVMIDLIIKLIETNNYNIGKGNGNNILFNIKFIKKKYNIKFIKI